MHNEAAKSLNPEAMADNKHYAQPPWDALLTVNGARLSANGLIAILDMVTKPIPGRWYTFARVGDCIQVTQRQDAPLPSVPTCPTQASPTPTLPIRGEDEA